MSQNTESYKSAVKWNVLDGVVHTSVIPEVEKGGDRDQAYPQLEYLKTLDTWHLYFNKEASDTYSPNHPLPLTFHYTIVSIIHVTYLYARNTK